jgi:hypothetical protein
MFAHRREHSGRAKTVYGIAEPMTPPSETSIRPRTEYRCISLCSVVDSVISYGNFQSLGNIIWPKWPKVHQTRPIIWQFLNSWQYHTALGPTIDHTVPLRLWSVLAKSVVQEGTNQVGNNERGVGLQLMVGSHVVARSRITTTHV